MALHNREICKVGESPSKTRRPSSPRRMMSIVNEDESNVEDPLEGSSKNSPESPKSPKISPRNTPSPSAMSSNSDQSKGERRSSSRLLMQRSERAESVMSKGSKSPKHAAWKTSKFFSRSMASGELLKGFKKLSTATSITTGPPEESSQAGEANKNTDSKSFKNRFSSLRRKSGSDADKVQAVDEESLKQGSSELKGIVCKKEDIMSLIKEVSKERRVSSPGELTIPPSLPTTPVPVLKSPSLKGSPIHRGNFRSSRSSSLDPVMVPNERIGLRPTIRPPVRTVVHPPPSPSSTLLSRRVSDDLCIQKKSFLEVIPDTKRRLSGPLIEIKENKILETNAEIETGAAASSNEEPAVQWDEGNFVDPTLLGGAIEAFLKGMGPSTSTATEKRVSFKKS